MHTLVLVLMSLVFVSTLIKLTFLKRWQLGLIVLLCAVFTGLSWRWAIEQSRSQIEAWLANQSLMLDTSVVLTFEVICQTAYSVLAVRLMDRSERVGRSTLFCYRLLRIFPGILILPVIFATEVSAIYALPGFSFAAIAWTLAAVILVILSLGSIAVRYVIPEKELRLEIFFLLNMLIMLLGIICTVKG